MIDFAQTTRHIKGWLVRDYNDHPVRFIAELIAWALSIGCALTMALTVPNPPLIAIYPVWILGCSVWIWAAWTRGSTGLFLNYLVLISIDCIGLFRLITS